MILISENSDLKLRWDIEKGSSGSYSISRDNKLAMERELLLWLSCFIICTPWILAQCETTAIIILPDIEAGPCYISMSACMHCTNRELYSYDHIMNNVVDCLCLSCTITDIPNDKWKNMTRLSLAVYSLLVLVGIFYFVKDFGKYAFTMQDLYNYCNLFIASYVSC